VAWRDVRPRGLRPALVGPDACEGRIPGLVEARHACADASGVPEDRAIIRGEPVVPYLGEGDHEARIATQDARSASQLGSTHPTVRKGPFLPRCCSVEKTLASKVVPAR
jgi:hypothetical protein